jgi:hypothetical protein
MLFKLVFLIASILYSLNISKRLLHLPPRLPPGPGSHRPDGSVADGYKHILLQSKGVRDLDLPREKQ